MATSTGSTVAPESVPPTDAEISTFEKMVELMNSFKKTHVFLTAVKLGVFTAAHGSRKTADEIRRACNVHETKTLDAVLDILVTEKLLNRYDGDDVTAPPVYENSSGADLLLGDASAPTHLSAIGMLMHKTESQMEDWLQFGEILSKGKAEKRTTAEGGDPEQDEKCGHKCKPQPNCHVVEDNEDENVVAEDEESWSELYEMFEGFMRIGFNVLAEKFDFSRFKHVVDIGGGTCQLSRILCRKFQNLRCTNFDLPRMQGCARKRMEQIGQDVSDRITLLGGNCLKEDEIPQPTDVIIIANVMHGFDSDEMRQLLVKKAYDALSPGGVFIVVEDLINETRSNESALLWQLSMDVTMGISHSGGDDGHHHTHTMLRRKTLRGWCEAVGFDASAEPICLVGSMQAAVATKK